MEAEIFPYHPMMEEIEPLDDIDYTRNKVLKGLVAAKRIVVFMIYSLCGRVSMSSANQTTNLERYFLYQTKAAFHLNKFVPDNFQWEKVEQRLNGTSECQKKNNTDVRTCFRIDDHKFSVPGLFTFGQRTVPPGCVHVLETTTVPILAYRLSEEAIQENRVILKESSFDASDEMWYVRYVLQPNTRYQFDVGTTYLFVTVQKTVFSLHVLANPEGRIYGVNPFQHTKLLNDPYKAIPETPRPVLPIRRETTFLAPPPQTTSGNVFKVPMKRPRKDDATPISKKRPREEDVTPKRPREEDVAPITFREEDVTPRIIKMTKGPYDYPHPDVSTEWCRVDERMKNEKPRNDLPVQTDPIDYSRSSRRELPALVNVQTFVNDFLEEIDDEELDDLPVEKTDELENGELDNVPDRHEMENGQTYENEFLEENEQSYENEFLEENEQSYENEMENGQTYENELENEQSIDFSFLDELGTDQMSNVTNEDIDEFFKDLL